MGAIVKADRMRSGDVVVGVTPAIAPVVGAVSYPFLLVIFHQIVGRSGNPLSTLQVIAASVVLASTAAIPAVAIWTVYRCNLPTALRRLCYFTVVAPTLYVFLGVLLTLAGANISDLVVWVGVWLLLAGIAVIAGRSEESVVPGKIPTWLRVAHGISAAILCAYILFHLANHLVGLRGPAAHAQVMAAGRSIYRASIIEPLLVMMLLFQVATGLQLAWRWSASRQDFFRTFQIASGVYLAIFILCHMNSVFVYARLVRGIQTDWTFATGSAPGLLRDPWNIRLVPHYAIGVFFVLSHLASGARIVALSHGLVRLGANRLWLFGATLSAAIAIAILSGMCGVRV
jgi:hypothetical protein